MKRERRKERECEMGEGKGGAERKVRGWLVGRGGEKIVCKFK